MAISFEKLFKIFDERHITSYVARQDKFIAQSTFSALKHGRADNVTVGTIDRLCKYLGCQPGDIMEYVPDEEGE